MEIDDFIEAIIDEPDVDDHRLILADFLEERDDPRAGLIRLQFEMKTLDKTDPKWSRLRSKELKLLKQHGGFGEPPKFGRILAWHGGFVDEIETTLAQLATKSEELLAKTTVRAIQAKSESKRFKKILESKHLHRLRKLTLKNNHIPNQEMCEFLALGSLSHLKELTIADGNLNNELAKTIGRMKHFEGLESLDLNGGGVTSVSAEAIVNSPFLNGLKSLGMRYFVCDKAAELIAGSDKFSSLTTLEFSGEISDRGIAAIHNSSFRESLEELTIDSDLGSRISSGFGNPLPNLKSLTLASSVTDDVIVEIAGNYSNLESLDLTYNSLTDVSAEALAKSKLLSSLKRLTLTQNDISMRGIEMIRESEHFNGKTKLYCRSNRVSRAQIRTLKEKYGKTFGNFGPDWHYG